MAARSPTGSSVRSTARFLRRYARPREPVTRELLASGRSATVFLPRRPAPGRTVPAWVLLHGVTVPGRHHAALRRMAGALAEAGHLVLVPEVPSWSSLEVAPREAEAATRDALGTLHRWREADARRVGLMGFSVAGTWALEVAAGDLQDRFAAVASMGGYLDLYDVLLWMIAGEGTGTPTGAPDPYGRWIMGASLLPLLEGDAWGAEADRHAAADALRRLALAAGRHGAYSGLPVYDPLIADLRRSLPPGALQTWDLLAQPGGAPAGGVAAHLLASAMAGAAAREEPMLDPAGRLGGLRAATFLLHGHGDRLMPSSEARRLWEEIPAPARRRILVTRLLGHTKRSEAGGAGGPLGLAREGLAFARFVEAMLSAVEEPG